MFPNSPVAFLGPSDWGLASWYLHVHCQLAIDRLSAGPFMMALNPKRCPSVECQTKKSPPPRAATSAALTGGGTGGNGNGGSPEPLLPPISTGRAPGIGLLRPLASAASARCACFASSASSTSSITRKRSASKSTSLRASLPWSSSSNISGSGSICTGTPAGARGAALPCVPASCSTAKRGAGFGIALGQHGFPLRQKRL